MDLDLIEVGVHCATYKIKLSSCQDKKKRKKRKKCHFYRLGRRVDRMEKSIGSIVTKIDAVLAKLETMERGRNKRKATMSKILGTITESDGRKYYEELDL